MLAIVNKLGLLYKKQGKLVKQMYKRALQDYEKTLGTNNIYIYISVLNTIWAFGSFFEY